MDDMPSTGNTAAAVDFNLRHATCTGELVLSPLPRGVATMGSLIDTIAELPGRAAEQHLPENPRPLHHGPGQQTQRLWLRAAICRSGPGAVEPQYFPSGVRWLVRKLMHSDPEIYRKIN